MQRKTAARDEESRQSDARDFIWAKSLGEVPPVVVLSGDASYLKDRVVRRLIAEIFPAGQPECRRFAGPRAENDVGSLPLCTVLDELRTLSFLSSRRMAVVEPADAFLAAHREALEPYVEKGFAGAHLVLSLDRNLDGRTRIARTITAKGWVIRCARPYDRPPPWDAKTPAWESDLSRWVVLLAREKSMSIDTRTAFLLHERVGTDLGVIAEEIDKLATYVGARGTGTIDAAAIEAVAPQSHEQSIFDVVNAALEGRRADAWATATRLFQQGYRSESGSLVIDPPGIALPLLATMLTRVRSLRRAHELAAQGAGPEEWVRLGLAQRPFLLGFQRQLKATPPARIAAIVDRLYQTDRRIKSGGDARRLVFLLLAQ